MNEDAQKKLNEINTLQKEIGVLQQKLEKLLSPEKQVVLPPDFSLIDEVLKFLKEKKTATHTKEIVRSLSEKFPHYGIDRKKVASALVYLKSKKKTISLVGRGTYQFIEITAT